MRRDLLASAAAIVMATSCSAGSSSSSPIAPTTAAPSNTAFSSAYAVVQQTFREGLYSIDLVGVDGRIAGHATAQGPSPDFGAYGPLVSTSDHKVYFLDGPSTLKSLEPYGKVAVAATLPSTATIQARFSVSPDDRRIAVALLTYDVNGLAITYGGMQMYVSDLNGANRVDIFSSPSVAEWPVAWLGANLVVAVAIPFANASGLGGSRTPFGALGGYHLVNSATGDRIAELCPAKEGLPEGLPTHEGVLCERYSDAAAMFDDWTGAEIKLGNVPPNPVYQALEPGTRNFIVDNTNLSGTSIYVTAATGELRNLPGEVAELGFITKGKLLMVQGPLVVYDLASSSSVSVALQPGDAVGPIHGSYGFLAGRLPGGL
jgi:hypothetical protein